MDTAVTTGPPVHFINVEYFFRLLYDLLFGPHTVSAHVGSIGGGEGLITLFSQIWLAVTIIAYIACVYAAWMLIYYTMRYWQVKSEDDEKYTTIDESQAHVEVEHSRWAYITQLIESPQETDWRQAIIEADIMLDEVLTRNGYLGGTIGDKLKTANPARFMTLRNAWDAHMVRNEIAHSGSAYQLTNAVAFRTIANFEAVFREFNEI
jgi:hypothetical protein